MRTFNAELQIITTHDKLVAMRRRTLRGCRFNVNNLECNATWKSIWTTSKMIAILS